MMYWYDEIKRILEGRQMTASEIAHEIFENPNTTQIGHTSACLYKFERQGYCRKCGEVVVKGKKRVIWELI